MPLITIIALVLATISFLAVMGGLIFLFGGRQPAYSKDDVTTLKAANKVRKEAERLMHDKLREAGPITRWLMRRNMGHSEYERVRLGRY